MSGFFSLGSKEVNQDQQQTTNNTNNNNSQLFLFKNESEIYNKGFELWQQYYQLNQQRQVEDHVDFLSVGTANYTNTANYRPSASGLRVNMRSSGGGGGGVNCQDCGNQAKKDCIHLRCRTCCKSRGFPCETHVKSTWVPASKRRERQQQLAALQQNQQQLTPKRQRESPPVGGDGGSALACTSARNLPVTTIPGSHEVGHFPAEVNSPAVFRCARVTGIDEDDQFAYQTAVNIGGHVFKGILYDQGLDSGYPGGSGGGGEGSSNPQQPLDLIAAAAAATTTTSDNNAPMLDPSVYPAPLSAFMAGTQFFPPPRS